MTEADALRATLRRLLALEPEALPPEHSFLVPDGEGPFPAVLYAHLHGGQYALGRRELTEGWRCLQGPYARDLLAAGYAVLCIDMPGFGARQGEGNEGALAKAALWQGRTLMGRMLGELLAGFDWLAAHPKVDAARIATLGLSMGGTHAYWLAALEPRVAAVAQLCVLADIGPMIRDGSFDKHNHYMTVPGLLHHAEMGDVAGLVAPRPQLICHGGADALTPEPARCHALTRVRAAYAGSDALELFTAPEAGHEETPDMRRRVLDFLSRTIGTG